MSDKGKLLSTTKFRTPEFRVSFPAVFEPKAFADEKPSWSLVCLFDKDADLSVFQQAVSNVIKEKLGGARPPGLKVPQTKDGDAVVTTAGKPRPETAGKRMITLRNKHRAPRVVDASVRDIDDPTQIYGGCYGCAIVDAYLWSNSFGKGISFNLLGFQKTRDGDPFQGAARDEDFEMHENTEDFTASSDSPDSPPLDW